MTCRMQACRRLPDIHATGPESSSQPVHELEEGLPADSAAEGTVADLHLASDAQKRGASCTRAIEHLATPPVLSTYQDSKFRKRF